MACRFTQTGLLPSCGVIRPRLKSGKITVPQFLPLVFQQNKSTARSQAEQRQKRHKDSDTDNNANDFPPLQTRSAERPNGTPSLQTQSRCCPIAVISGITWLLTTSNPIPTAAVFFLVLLSKMTNWKGAPASSSVRRGRWSSGCRRPPEGKCKPFKQRLAKWRRRFGWRVFGVGSLRSVAPFV